jgi:hypothetical protein
MTLLMPAFPLVKGSRLAAQSAAKKNEIRGGQRIVLRDVRTAMKNQSEKMHFCTSHGFLAAEACV